MSLMKASRAAGFIVSAMPNSLAAFSELEKSPPALARPSTCAPEFCAWSRYEEKSEVLSGTRTAPTTLPPLAVTTRAADVLQLRAERVVGGEEEPRLAALVEDRRRGAVAERGRVVGVMDRVGRAILAGERGARRADRDERDFLLLGDGIHGEADAGVGAAEQHRQPVAVGPFAKLLGAERGLVLVIVGQHLDRLAERRAAEVRDRHLDRFDPLGTDDVGVEAGHVVDVADHDLVGVRLRGERPDRGENRPRNRYDPVTRFHFELPSWLVRHARA